MNNSTAILLITFNRLDTSKLVFEAIKMAEPPRLYIASDGPRDHVEGEAAAVNEVREYLLKNIDWPCEVKTLFRETNLYCAGSISGAISWFFENEEMGIILEHDTVPDQSFFQYCQELLIKYKTDERVGVISGNNHIYSYKCKDSYLFSKNQCLWGWATWRRAWKNHDQNLKNLESDYRDDIISNMGYSKRSINHWEMNIESIELGRVSTWDYQWFLSLGAQNQLCIFPATNLVANIGFGENATHCKGDAPLGYTDIDTLEFPLKHPDFFVPNRNFEKKFEVAKIKVKTFWKKLIPRSLKKQIKKILFKYKINY
jgi:hypothetical protein